MTDTSKATPRFGPVRWHRPTCTHGGYGKCSFGCLREGLWGYNPLFEKETWLGTLMLQPADINDAVRRLNAYDAMRDLEAAARSVLRTYHRGGVDYDDVMLGLSTAVAALAAAEDKVE